MSEFITTILYSMLVVGIGHVFHRSYLSYWTRRQPFTIPTALSCLPSLLSFSPEPRLSHLLLHVHHTDPLYDLWKSCAHSDQVVYTSYGLDDPNTIQISQAGRLLSASVTPTSQIPPAFLLCAHIGAMACNYASHEGSYLPKAIDTNKGLERTLIMSANHCSIPTPEFISEPMQCS